MSSPKSANIFLCLACLFVSAVSLGQIYKTIDEHGNVSYSDKPPEGKRSETVELPNLNTTPGIDVKAQIEKRKKAPTFSLSYQINLLSPSDGSHLLADQRDLRIAADYQVDIQSNSPDQELINSELTAARVGLRIEILFDGVAIPSNNGEALIEEIGRGEHKIKARLLSPNGQQLALSPEVTVWVHRPIVRRPKTNHQRAPKWCDPFCFGLSSAKAGSGSTRKTSFISI